MNLKCTRTNARTTLLALSLSGAAALALLGGASPTSRSLSTPPANQKRLAIYDRFSVHEWEGLVCQINNVSASVNYSASSWGAPGARVNRNLTISGMLADFTGKRIFRLKGTPRLLELTDLNGRDMTSRAKVHINPQMRSMTAFTAPTGSSINQNFSVSLASFTLGANGIGRIAMEVDVEMAADIERHDFPPKVTPAMEEFAPNFVAGISRYAVSSDGALYLTLDYRIPKNDGPAPVFHTLEIIDTNGDVITATTDRKEIVTRDSTMGLVFIKGVNIGSREVASVRVTVLTDLISHTFTLEERDMPLLSE